MTNIRNLDQNNSRTTITTAATTTTPTTFNYTTASLQQAIMSAQQHQMHSQQLHTMQTQQLQENQELPHGEEYLQLPVPFTHQQRLHQEYLQYDNFRCPPQDYHNLLYGHDLDYMEDISNYKSSAGNGRGFSYLPRP